VKAKKRDRPGVMVGMQVSEKTTISIDGRELSLSNLNKVFYPAKGFTKAQVIDYYSRIAPAVLQHLRGRPVTLKRYPDGIEGKFFLSKGMPRAQTGLAVHCSCPGGEG
jgi:bifunctional non-homologous end joining protein LigD